MGCTGSVPEVAQSGPKNQIAVHQRYSDDSRDRTSVTKIDVTPHAHTFHEKYILGEKLGKGAFAHVYLTIRVCQTKLDDPERRGLAVKVSDLRAAGDPSGMDAKACRAAERETSILKKVMNVEHCVRVHDVYMEGFLSYIVMEKCDMPLIQALDREPTLTEKTFIRYIREMTQAVANIHALRVAHRDVKPDNFLCTGPKLTVKLCDFGLAEVVGRNPEDTGLKGVYGTAPFMAPDMLNGGCYGTKVDVWSLGVICYVLMLGHFPYQPQEATTKAMKAAILSGYPEPTFRAKKSAQGNARISADAKTLMHVLLARDPNQRPTAAQALGMPWFDESRPLDGDAAMNSLRPRLVSAKRSGAFDMRKPTSLDTCDIDGVLCSLQAKYHKLEDIPSRKAPFLTQMSSNTSSSTRAGSRTTGPEACSGLESEPSLDAERARRSNGSRQ